MQKHKQKIFYILLILVIVTGIFVRFWKLGTIPPGIHYDEAYNGIDATHVIETGEYKLFYPDNYGREGLHINVISFFIQLFGVSSFSLRFANALWGSLTLIGFFFLLRELKLSKLSLLLGVFMLSFSFWHLDFSRTAYRAIMVPLVIVWMTYFFLKGLNTQKQKRKYIFFALSGIFLGIGFNTYISFRIAPMILAILAICYFYFKKGVLKENWKPLLFFILAGVLVMLPLAIYFSSHLKDFMDRSGAVSIFNSHKLSAGQAFLRSFGQHLQAFFVNGDNNPRHNYNNQALIPAGWIAFVVVGFVISIKEIIETIVKKYSTRKNNQKEYTETSLFYVSVLAQSIFWLMLVPGILTIEGIPHSLRIIGVIPGVFLFAVLPIEYILKIYRRIVNSSDKILKVRATNLTLTFIVGIFFVIFVSGFIQTYTYFELWAKDLRTAGGFERKLYLLGTLIHDLPVHKNNYVITAYNTSISQDRKNSSYKTTQFISYPKIKSYEFYRPIDGINNINCDDIQLVFWDSDQWLRDQYRAKCPGLVTNKYTYDKNKYVYFVMTGHPSISLDSGDSEEQPVSEQVPR